MSRIAHLQPLVLLAVTSSVFAQGQTQGQTPQPPPAAPQEQAFDAASLETLRALHASVAEKQKALEEATDAAESQRLQAEITRLQRTLESVATGVDLDAWESEARPQLDLLAELQDLVRPLIQELKDATSGPRQIEQLRSQAAFYDERRALAQRALRNLARLQQLAQDADARRLLRERTSEWQRREAESVQRAAVARHQAEAWEREQQSIFEATGHALAEFFRTRGLNLLLAVIAFAAVFSGLRFASRPLLRFRRTRRAAKERPFYLRLLRVLYHSAIAVAAAVAALMVLYAAGDWTLLGLALLFLVGLGWASKTAVPRMLEEARLMLNLGAVRERERVVFAGLPWRVDTLNLYSYLTNPALSGGRIRLPLRDLIGLHSRPWSEKEPWFPCEEGDWVQLADGTRGRVVSQTPEMVQLVLIGGSRTTYQTASFLEQNPTNLSANFRLRATFGIDYRHQALCTTEIPRMMQASLQRELAAAVGEEKLIHVGVEFKEAGASSLDYLALVDLNGAVADRSEKLQRLISRVLVDACNEHGWVIPFTQITLHQA